MDQEVGRDSNCFCCGADNERGLRLVFAYPEPGRAEVTLEVPAHFSGWRSMTHGGFLSMLLDEAMAHACIHEARTAVTAEMTVRFKKPVETGSRIRVVGNCDSVRGRLINTTGSIHDAAGTCIAEASARFLRMST